MGMPAESRKRWSAVEVRELNAHNPLPWPRYEVIDGELLVTPAPSWTHQAAVGRLFTILTDYVSAEGIGHVFVAPADVAFQAGARYSRTSSSFRWLRGGARSTSPK